MTKRQTRKEREAFLDGLKDEIDSLNEITSPKHRLEAAQELVEYITLHYVDYK